MKFLHAMIRVGDLDRSLHFFCDILGLREVRRSENEKGRYTLVYLAAPADYEDAKRSGAPTMTPRAVRHRRISRMPEFSGAKSAKGCRQSPPTGCRPLPVASAQSRDASHDVRHWTRDGSLPRVPNEAPSDWSG